MSAHRVLAVVFASVLIALAFPIPATAQNPARKPASEPYSWKNVQMVGGGFVDGIIFHPTAKGVRYARTDMGGAYRWNGQTKRWEPLLDWVPYEDSNLMGVESMAVDASDSEPRVPRLRHVYQCQHARRRHPALQRPRQDFCADQRAFQVRRQRGRPRQR